MLSLILLLYFIEELNIVLIYCFLYHLIYFQVFLIFFIALCLTLVIIILAKCDKSFVIKHYSVIKNVILAYLW